ncbi:alpha/beta fold hydrolase [Mycolicibacter icosiumassiliensis]|uniref:alpha/beta fold hydrolase n=1 Tax=Mycolicibacter icosiumassiliensis TaxID=1792835 RepID=UPI00083267F1|nr:alpha/beta hydrolase [Mycolicibacter icosiumassiliensis]
MNPDHRLHVHRYGPDGPVGLLAVHGLTGHGARWRYVAEQLPDIAVAAPDLIGHGHSSWAAPWSIDANVAALAALLEGTADGPVPVVAHSFGGAIALHLAAARPDLVDALILLDPAIGLDGEWMATIAAAMLASPDYPDPAEARAEKENGAWSDVDPVLLDVELDEHLVALPSGRFGWRISVPAVMSYWSELARAVVLPQSTPTTLVRATRTSPPYVEAALIDGLRDRLGTNFQLVDFDCNHMVDQARPTEAAAVIRAQLDRR